MARSRSARLFLGLFKKTDSNARLAMSQLCPNCQKRLQEFAVGCPYCGWNLAENIQNAAPAVPQENMQIQPEEVIEEEPPLLVSEDYMSAIEAGNFSTALDRLNKVIINASDDRLGELYGLRGYVNLKMGHYGRAESDCDEAIARYQDQPQTLAWRAAARGEQDKWRAAFDDLSAAYENSTPHDKEQYLQLMQAYSESAKAYFQEQVTQGNESAQLFFDRAWVYLKASKLSKAERDFEITLQHDPNHAGAAVGLAELKYDQDEFEKSLELAELAFGDDSWKRKALEIHARAARKLGKAQLCFNDLAQLRKLIGKDSRLAMQCGELRSVLGDHAGAIADLTHAYKANQLNFSALLKRADCYASIRNFALAETDYIHYIKNNVDEAAAYARLGQVYLMQNRLDQAQETFDLALDKDAICFEAFKGRSEVYLAKKQFDRALTDCENAIRLDSMRGEMFGIRAKIYSGLSQYTSAIEDFSRAIEKSPTVEERASQLFQRGAVYYELAQMDNAIKDFEAATALCPTHAGTWIWRAAACARLELFSEAIISLQKAMAVRPSSAQQYRTIGKPVAEAAIKHLTQRLQRGQSDDAQTFADRALAHAFLGNVDSAIKDYDRSLKKQPDNESTLIRRAQMLARRGDHNSAIKDYTAVIQKSPRHHWARYCRAYSRLNSKQVDKAKSDILKSIKLAPQHPRYHVLLAEILQKSQEHSAAIQAYDRAIALDLHDPQLYASRGKVLANQRHHLKSIHDFTRSLELLPSQPAVLIARGNAYLRLDQATSARRDFESALGMDNMALKAYTGRSTVLAAMDEHEQALIFLTKAFHRFSNPRDLAELLLARGKQFYKMGRFIPAAADFSAIVDLLRDQNPAAVAAARFVRALARTQLGQSDLAIKDLRRCVSVTPNNVGAQQALEHLVNRGEGDIPAVLQPPANPIRPTRPSVLAEPLKIKSTDDDPFANQPPFDTWLVRTEDRHEYGPVHKKILDQWAREGRIVSSMRLLRADWSKWKRVAKVFPQLVAPATVFESPDDVSLLPQPLVTNEEPDRKVPFEDLG